MTEFVFSGVGSLIPFSGGAATNPSLETATPEISFGSVLQRAIGVAQQARISTATSPPLSHGSSSLSLLATHPTAYRLVVSQTGDMSAKIDVLGVRGRNDAMQLPLQIEQVPEPASEKPQSPISIVIQLSGQESSSIEAVDDPDNPKSELQQLQGAVDALVHVLAALHGQKATANNSALASAEATASSYTSPMEGSGRARVLAYGGEENSQVPSPLGQEGEVSETRDAGNNAAIVPLQADTVPPNGGGRDKSASGNMVVPVHQGVVQEDVIDVAQGKAGEQTQSSKEGKTTPREEVASGMVIARQSMSTETTPATPQKIVFPERVVSNEEPSQVYGASQKRAERESVENNDGKNAPTQGSVVQEQTRGASSFMRTSSNHIAVDVPAVGSVEISIRATGQGRAHVDIAVPQRASITPATFATLLQEVTQKLESDTFPMQSTVVQEDALLGDAVTEQLSPLPTVAEGRPANSSAMDEVAVTPTPIAPAEQSEQGTMKAANNDTVLQQERASSKQAVPLAGQEEKEDTMPDRTSKKLDVLVQSKGVAASSVDVGNTQQTMQKNQQKIVDAGHKIRVKTETPPTTTAPIIAHAPSSMNTAMSSSNEVLVQQPAVPLSIESVRFTFVGTDERTVVGNGAVAVPSIPSPLMSPTYQNGESHQVIEQVDTPASAKTMVVEEPIANVGKSAVAVSDGGKVKAYGEQEQAPNAVSIPVPDSIAASSVPAKEKPIADGTPHNGTVAQTDDIVVPMNSQERQQSLPVTEESLVSHNERGGAKVVNTVAQSIPEAAPHPISSTFATPDSARGTYTSFTVPLSSGEEALATKPQAGAAVLPNTSHNSNGDSPSEAAEAQPLQKPPVERAMPRTADKGARVAEEMFLPLSPRRESEQTDEPKTQEEHREIEPEQEVATEARQQGTTTVHKREHSKVEQLATPLSQRGLGGVANTAEEGVPISDRTEEQPLPDTEERSDVQDIHDTKHAVEPKDGILREEARRGQEPIKNESRGTVEQHSESKTNLKVVDGTQGEHRGQDNATAVSPIRETKQSENVPPTAKPAVPSMLQVDAVATPVVSLPENVQTLYAAFREIENLGGFTVQLDVAPIQQEPVGGSLVQVNNSQAYGNSQEHTIVQPREQVVETPEVPTATKKTGTEQAVFAPVLDVNTGLEKSQPYNIQSTAIDNGAISPTPEVGMAIEEGKQNELYPFARVDGTDEHATRTETPSSSTQESVRIQGVQNSPKESAENGRLEKGGQRAPSGNDSFAPLSIVREDNSAENRVLSQQNTDKEIKPFVAEPDGQPSRVIGEQMDAVVEGDKPETSAPLHSDAKATQPQQHDKGHVHEYAIAEPQSMAKEQAVDVPRAEITEQPKAERPIVSHSVVAKSASVVSDAGAAHKYSVEQPRTVDTAVRETVVEPSVAGLEVPKAVEKPVHASVGHRVVPMPSVVQPENVPLREYGEPRKAEEQTLSAPATPSVRSVAVTAAVGVVPVRTTAGKLSANRSNEPWREIARKEGGSETASARELPLMDAIAQLSPHSWRDTPEPVHRERTIADDAADSARAPEEARGASAHINGDDQQGAARDNNQTKQHGHGAHADAVPVRLSVPHQVKPAPSFMRSFSNVLPADMPQVVQSVMRAVPSGAGGVVHMALNPEALGEVVVALTVLDGVADVVIDTEHKDAQKAVEAHLPALKERLAQTGLQVEHVEVRTKHEPTVQSDASRFGRQGGQAQEEHKSRQEFLRSFRHLHGTNYEPIETPELRSTPSPRPQVQNGRFERYA